MLVIPVSHIPAEGKDIDDVLTPESLQLEADEGFALEEGRIRGRLERGEDEGVHFRGRLEGRLDFQCGRCLEPFTDRLDADLDLFFLPRHQDAADEEEEQEVQLSDRDMVVTYYAEERIDLGEMVREQIHLAVPMRRLCREDCKGLCPSCGANRNLTACDCRKAEETDERMAPLRKLFDKGSS